MDFNERFRITGLAALDILAKPDPTIAFVLLAWNSEDKMLHAISNMESDEARRMMKEHVESTVVPVGTVEFTKGDGLPTQGEEYEGELKRWTRVQ